MNWSALFAYRDGLLYWKSPGSGRQLDWPAGSVRQDGYHAINVGKKKYRAHRIIWEMYNGAIPEGLVVDHIEADPGNNRIENLRPASVARNNTRSFSNSRHGWKGVQARANGKFQAVLQLGHVTLCLAKWKAPFKSITLSPRSGMGGRWGLVRTSNPGLCVSHSVDLTPSC
jgi:hypothetical protein